VIIVTADGSSDWTPPARERGASRRSKRRPRRRDGRGGAPAVARVKWSWTVLIVGLVAGRCLAQQAAEPAITPGFGPALPAITPGASVTDLSLNVSETHSSNVDGESPALGALRGLTPADFITNAYATMVLSRPVGRQTAYLEANIGYIDFAKNSVLSRSNIEIAGGGAGSVGLCRTSLTGAYSRGQAEQYELVLADTGARGLDERSDVVQNAVAGFSATCGHSVGLAPTFDVNETVVTNQNVEFQTADIDLLSLSGGLAYRTASLGTLSATGQYSQTRYPGRFIVGQSGEAEESVDSYGASLSYVTSVHSRVQASAAVSYEVSQPYAFPSAVIDSINYSLAASYSIIPSLTATVTIYQQTGPSSNAYALLARRQFYQVEINYTIGALNTLGLGLTRRELKFEDLVIPQILSPTLENISRVYVSASRPFGRRLTVKLNLGYQQVDANYPGFGYPSLTVGVTATSMF
jgi:hypothetical protein